MSVPRHVRGVRDRRHLQVGGVRPRRTRSGTRTGSRTRTRSRTRNRTGTRTDPSARTARSHRAFIVFQHGDTFPLI